MVNKQRERWRSEMREEDDERRTEKGERNECIKVTNKLIKYDMK